MKNKKVYAAIRNWNGSFKKVEVVLFNSEKEQIEFFADCPAAFKPLDANQIKWSFKDDDLSN